MQLFRSSPLHHSITPFHPISQPLLSVFLDPESVFSAIEPTEVLSQSLNQDWIDRRMGLCMISGQWQ